MDDQAAAVPIKFNRFLPYWAVFQSDLKQGLKSWLYRVWVLLTFAAASGYMLYRYGAKQVAGFTQPAPEMISDLLSWIVLGSLTLIIALTAGTICSERGTVADSILSRGISRYQYFLGKWHARLVLILGTFFALSSLALVCSNFLLHSESLSVSGSAVALGIVAVLLIVVTTLGVSISAMSTNTLVSISLAWIFLYGTGFLLSFLPENYPAPDRILHSLPNVLRGFYDLQFISRLVSGALSASLLAALSGMIYFSRRDV